MKTVSPSDIVINRSSHTAANVVWDTRKPGGVSLLPAFGLAGCLLAGTLMAGTASSAAPASVDATLAQQMSAPAAHGWASVIVKTKGTLSTAQEAQLLGLHAGIYRHLPIVQSVALRLPTRNLAKLAALPFVDHLSADVGVKKSDEFTVADTGASTAWTAPYSVSGAGVTVAVLDSGIRYVQDLQASGGGASRITNAISFVPNDYNTDDLCGHGTHVAGIIAGNGAMSTGPQYTHTFYGIARQANLVNVRVLDANGQSTVSTVLAGLQWIVANKTAYKIKVLNMSLGHPVGESYKTDPLCQAVEAAWKAGIVVVCAAGNDGRLNAATTTGADNEGYGANYGSINSPGNDPYVITVGAMKTGATSVRGDDTIATYSSRGPSRLDLVMKPDIVAPGNQIISLYSYNSTLFRYNTSNSNGLPAQAYQNTAWTGYSTDYFRLSGTSMAAPVVAGAAALLLQKYPTLSPDSVKARLMTTADRWAAANGKYDPCTYGAGYLDIPSALQSTLVVTSPAFSPPLIRDASGNVMVDTNNVIWGKNVVWGSNVVWGKGTLDALNVVWGKSILLGTSAISSSNVVWGKSVWTSNVIWGATTDGVDLSSVAIKGE